MKFVNPAKNTKNDLTTLGKLGHKRNTKTNNNILAIKKYVQNTENRY